jgi:predicted glycogen debranching enzyme
MMYRFGPTVVTSVEAAGDREWCLADGLGGYASGTVGGLRTRRAHGLLAVATTPPAGRFLGLAAMDLTVAVGDKRYQLFTHEWADGRVEPQGHRRLTRCDIWDGLPKWYWAVPGAVVSLQIAMGWGRSVVGLQYRVEQSDGPITLEMEPLVTWRAIDGECQSTWEALAVDQLPDGVAVADQFRLRGDGWQPGGGDRGGLAYRSEDHRSFAATEDLRSVGRFVVTLDGGDTTEIEAWAGDLQLPAPHASDLILAAQLRARRLAAASESQDDIDRGLVLSADQFITCDTQVVAGYPYLGERVRDTLIGYRGLFLETARHAEGRTLLLRMLGRLADGLLVDDPPAAEPTGGPVAVDASLWLFQAIYHHTVATGDLDLVATAVPALAQTINFLINGNRYAGVDPIDGLLATYPSMRPQTWMDAEDDGAVTPRTGKPVELNALWLSGLSIVRDLAARVSRNLPGNRLDIVARQAFARFGGFMFGGGLADVIDGPFDIDRTLRPNQLLAVTLPFAPWSHAKAIVEAVQPLVTPIGLRTVGPTEFGFRGNWAGHPDDHQGTVWPWLMGPYADAIAIANINSPGLLDGLEDHVPLYGVGSVSAMADANTPFEPAGCPFHAMGVAEMLRIRHRLR